MINKKKIGKIQFYIGLILLLATIIGSIFIVNNIYIGTLVAGVEEVSTTWGEVGQEMNGTLIGIDSQVISNVVLQVQILKTTLSLYGVCALILIVLSLMMMLQGLANQSRK